MLSQKSFQTIESFPSSCNGSFRTSLNRIFNFEFLFLCSLQLHPTTKNFENRKFEPFEETRRRRRRWHKRKKIILFLKIKLFCFLAGHDGNFWHWPLKREWPDIVKLSKTFTKFTRVGSEENSEHLNSWKRTSSFWCYNFSS